MEINRVTLKKLKSIDQSLNFIYFYLSGHFVRHFVFSSTPPSGLFLNLRRQNKKKRKFFLLIKYGVDN